MVLDVVQGGVRYLAVPVGSPARGTALTRILGLKASPGWIVSPPSVREWRFSGIAETPSGTALYGPWAPSRSLSEILDLPPTESLPFLVRLAEALVLLKERRVPLMQFQTDAVLFCDDGSVLFLPSEVMRELRELRPFQQNRDTFESIHNPDMRGEEAVSFALGVILYKQITGAFPFRGDTPEEIHEQMRKLEILSPAEARPGFSAQASELVMAALTRARRRIPSVDDWAESLRSWLRDGVVRPGSAVSSPVHGGASIEVRRKSSEKRYRRRVFWEKNWRTAVIVAAIAIVVGAGLGSILKNVLAPRVTRGDTPQQVVQAFYSSMNKLDQMTMSACVVDGAGKAEINEVTNLYVISRVSTGYEGKSNIVAADDWDKAGRPAIPFPQTVYGATGLSITEEKSVPAPVYLVSYEKWTPLPGGSDETQSSQPPGPSYEGASVQDRVFLKQDRGDWVIYRIDRLRSDPLPIK